MAKDKIILLSILGIIITAGTLYYLNVAKKNDQADPEGSGGTAGGSSTTVVQDPTKPQEINIVGKPKAGSKPLNIIGKPKLGGK